MFTKKTFSTIVKVVMMIMMIFTLLIFNSKPVEATRPLVAVMKSKKVETTKVVSVSQDRAPVTPSEPNSCTYLPDPANGSAIWVYVNFAFRKLSWRNCGFDFPPVFLPLTPSYIQDFVLNLEEREEGEGERKVASDNELNFRQEAE
ncbi:hypothetical protein CMV_023713 [Castanea mollissima]|uniref:Uncharacterized protein n=1 Tax=Castanea mollissima TaxID=60419 RepID=A0A8J4VIN1_9ROSI|nr:hypothetical protein CMV_023713 [Castanea mollissima]